MASPDLKKYEYGLKPSDVVGTVILADATTQVVAVSDSTSKVVIGPFDATGLSTSYGFHTDYPLMFKLFCSDVVMDTTGTYLLEVTGSLGDATVQRSDEDSFGVTWSIRDWAGLTDADATVNLSTFPPLSSVTMNCVCGLSTDYIDRKSEGSYA